MKFSFFNALSTSFVAMSIVFVLLIFLQYIIKLQSFMLNLVFNKEEVPKVNIIGGNDDEEPHMEDELQDDLEIVAAIAAALSAYLDVPESNLKIKSIKRINNNWGQGI